jgi:hypothetical protein
MANASSSPTSVPDLQALQDGLNASIQTILKSYDQCTDPVQSAALLSQSQQLAAQMSQIETKLFHQEVVQATATMTAAFTAANGFTAQLKAMDATLEKASDIVSVAAKLVSVVTQILPYI